VFDEIFGSSFRDYRLLDAIASDTLRQLLVDSEQALADGYPKLSIAGCKMAHQRVVRAVRDRVHPERRREPIAVTRICHMLDTSSGPGKDIAKAFKELAEELQSEIDDVRDQVVSTSLGLPVTETRKYLHAAYGLAITETMSGRVTMTDMGRNPRSHEKLQEDARFMLDYLCREILLAEEAFPCVFEDVGVKLPLREQQLWEEIYQAPPN